MASRRDPAAASTAALRAGGEASAPLHVAFTLELTPAFVDAVADAVVLRLGAEHQQQQDEWLTTQQAAAYLAVPVKRIYNQIARRRSAKHPIPVVKDGTRNFFRKSELDEWRRKGGAA